MGTRFRGQVAVVTGASGAIGGAVARALAADSARLLVLGRDVGRLQKLESELLERSCDVEVIAGDLTDDAVLDEIESVAAGRMGRVDILVHCAGTFRAGRLESAPVADFDRQYAINVRAPYRLSQRLLPLLLSNRGQIVFINSNAGLVSHAEVGAYAASKHALRALADSLREEVNTSGVRVLSVYPGRTASEMQRRVCTELGQSYEPERLMTPEDVALPVTEALALPRTVELTDLRLRPMQSPR